MSRNSEEYRALIKANHKLAKAIALESNLTSLSLALVSNSLITVDQGDALRNEMHSKSDRAAKLVTLITGLVELDVDNYYAFLRILREEGSTYVSILNDLPQFRDHPSNPGI